MELSVIDEGCVRAVEGAPGRPFMLRAQDASRIVEACLSGRVRSALLYADNVTPRFFDLSSGEAGEVLQKLRSYRLRLALVCVPGSVHFSSRFGEVVAEERRAGYFGVFDTRAEALEWLEFANRS